MDSDILDTFEETYAVNTNDRPTPAAVNHIAEVLQIPIMENASGGTRVFTIADITPSMLSGVNLRKILSLPPEQRRSLERDVKGRIDEIIEVNNTNARTILTNIHDKYNLGPVDIYPSEGCLPAQLRNKPQEDLVRFLGEAAGAQGDPLERVTTSHFFLTKESEVTGKGAIFAYLRVLLEVLAKSNEGWGISYSV